MTFIQEVCQMARREVTKLLDDDCFKKLRLRNEYLIDKNSKLVQVIDQKIEQSKEELTYKLEQMISQNEELSQRLGFVEHKAEDQTNNVSKTALEN